MQNVEDFPIFRQLETALPAGGGGPPLSRHLNASVGAQLTEVATGTLIPSPELNIGKALEVDPEGEIGGVGDRPPEFDAPTVDVA